MFFLRKKNESDAERKIDELIRRVEADVKELGGFVVIGLNSATEGSVDGMMVALVHSKTTRPKMLQSTVSVLGMDTRDVFMSLASTQNAEVSMQSPFQGIKK